MSATDPHNEDSEVPYFQIDPTDGLEIFWNKSNAITLKQSCSLDGTEHIVVICVRDADAVADEIKRLAEEIRQSV